MEQHLLYTFLNDKKTLHQHDFYQSINLRNIIYQALNHKVFKSP